MMGVAYETCGRPAVGISVEKNVPPARAPYPSRYLSRTSRPSRTLYEDVQPQTADRASKVVPSRSIA
jgi:hypothetical protein